jgi:hypothetical protein
LTYIRYIKTAPYIPTDIYEFNESLYVGPTVGVILILSNGIIISHFNTICGSVIPALEVDLSGQIAVLCNYSNILLHLINGTYLNVSWASTIQYHTSIGFNGYGNFVLTANNGIYVFN